MKNKTLIFIALGLVAVTATGYFAFKSGKKMSVGGAQPGPGNLATLKENNNWDDMGGYRMVGPGGVAFYYDKAGTYKGRDDQQGNWVPA